MRYHRFLIDTRDGRIADETFAAWLRQDYLFVESAMPFIAALLAKAPDVYRPGLIGSLSAQEKELALFEERAAALNIDVRNATPAFACHAYVQFLMSTAYRRTFAEGYTVLFAAEKAYHDCWCVVREGIDPQSPWYPFVENWSGEPFAEWVDHLGSNLDTLAAAASDAEYANMAELFATTVLYEIAFWEMAITGEMWPGLNRSEPPLTGGTTVWRNPETEPGDHAWRGVVES
jgi:thiaminase/transcriptional activator TenA